MKRQFLASSRSALLALIAGVALAILQGCSSFPEKALDRRAGAQADDQTIEARALSRLSNETGSGNRLMVTSFNRYALLTGEVPDTATRSRIAELVQGIEGVQGVWNELTIWDSNSIAVEIDDPLVVSRVKAHLKEAGPQVVDHVRVISDAGTVFLLGIVNAQEAQEAIQIARTTDGVRYVVNVMQILSDAEIQRIEAALRPPVPVTNNCNCAEQVRTNSTPVVRETW